MGSVLVVAGPTSAGKTRVALAVAERFDAVILSADAMQVYRGMDIGTGKATPDERAGRTHIGLDVVDPDESFDVAAFLTLADAAIATHPRVVVAGGTSLYLRALVRGLVHTPPVDPGLRAEIEALDDLHGALTAVDPGLAARLHPNDRVRLVRGLEVYRASGQRLSELHAAHQQAPDRLVAHGVWLDRSDLDLRIDRRVHHMVEAGYVDEVRGLLAAGHTRSLKPMQSLGYRHLCAHVLDGMGLDAAVRLTQRDTRRFARKQRTWSKQLGYAVVTDPGPDAALEAATVAFEG